MLELKKIDLPFASDMLTEKFDDILELIHPNAFVYGGALRDIAAGLPLEGDLDIVAAGKDYDYCIARITNSAKWRSYHPRFDPVKKLTEKLDYRHSKIIGNVTVFETFGNRKVELVRAKAQFSKGYVSASLEVVKTVDIKCCGLVMDIYGTAFEVIEGAYQDCLDRVLRLNKLDSGFNIKNLKSRIAKLKDRGWTSRINMTKATKTLEKIEEAAKKEHLKKMSSMKQNKLKMSLKRRSSNTFEIIINGLGDEQLHTPNVNSAIRQAMKSVEYKLPFIVAQGGGTISIQFQTAGIKITSNVKRSIAEVGEAVMIYIKEHLLQSYSTSTSDLLRKAPASKYRKYAKSGRAKARRGGVIAAMATTRSDRPVEVTRSGETVEIERDPEEVEEQDVAPEVTPNYGDIVSSYPPGPNDTVNFETSSRAMHPEEVAERYDGPRVEETTRVDRGIRIPENPPRDEEVRVIQGGNTYRWSNETEEITEEITEEFEVIRQEPIEPPNSESPTHEYFFGIDSIASSIDSNNHPSEDENSEDDQDGPEEDN